MKIGIDCRMYSTSFTGIGRYVYELVSYLEKNDKENKYVLFFNEPSFSNYLPPNERFKKVLVNARHYSLSEQTIFLFKLYQEKLDLMHFTHFNAPIFYKKPSIVTIHDLTLSFYPGKKMTKFYHRWAYNMTIKSITGRSQAVIAVSNHTKKDIIEILNVSEEKIEVIYEGVNPSDFFIATSEQIDKIKMKYDIKNDYLFYVGVLREHKNLIRLIKAYSELIKEGENIDIVIAGKEDVYLEVRNTIVQEKLQKNIHLLGFVADEELNILYSGAKAVVYPSLYEGFGLPILEAMAHKIPVACSNISSLPEIAGNAGAVFFNPLSIESIKSGIKEVIHNAELRDKLIKNGEKRLKDFSWEKMGKEVLKLYNKVK